MPAGDTSGRDWEALITRIVLSCDLEGHEELVVYQGRAIYEGGFLKKLNKELRQQGKEGDLKLAQTHC